MPQPFASLSSENNFCWSCLRLKFINLIHSTYLTHTLIFQNYRILKVEKLIDRLSKLVGRNTNPLVMHHNFLLINFKDCNSLSNLRQQLDSSTTLILDNVVTKYVHFSIVRSKRIGYISLHGCEGLECGVLSSLICLHLQNLYPEFIIWKLVYTSSFHGYFWVIYSQSMVNFQASKCIWVQCRSKFQVTQECRRIIWIT